MHSAAVTFSVMSYNVLCDKYATRQQYGYCPSWALAWDYRKTTIMKELLDLTPDIIALQVHVHVHTGMLHVHVYIHYIYAAPLVIGY